MFTEYWRAAMVWQKAGQAQMEMALTASSVIQARMTQMWLGTMQPNEAMRMVFEKPAAFAKATEMAMRAGASGKGYAGIANAAIKPIGAKTKSNASRLSRRRK